ncbi:MAG: beta-galactosidase [Bacteroidota bacterium]
MKFCVFKRGILLYFLLLLSSVGANAQFSPASRNDHIFPASAQAKPFINYDNRGFLINGKRVFIASAGMEYARVPRALWRDRLLRLKRGGYNAIEIYTFWNYHEPKEGQFNFTGDHDLNAFLQLVKQIGLYAIVRVGPYYCGEWNMGGYPIWLKFKPGLRVREDNPQFLAAVDRYFDRLIPMVSKNQINHGGAVIMVQLENEHRAAWGTVTPNDYFKHLIDKTVSLGLAVPYFFSGLHSGNDPAGDVGNLDDAKRPNPWFSTEYWGVWFLNYGPQPLDSATYDRRTWKIIAHGGNGYNVYMAHGGTNFDYNNDRDMAASYDYGASIGQAGDLRPLYYSFKRANWFARSFQDVLANSTDDPGNKPTVSDTIVKVTTRKSPAGAIAFLDNPDSVAVQFKLTPPADCEIATSTPIQLAAGEIMPVVMNYQITPSVKIAWAPTRIYGIIPQGKTTTILLYGAANATASIYFDVPSGLKIKSGSANFKTSGNALSFNAPIAREAPATYSFEADGHLICIITINDALAKRTWFVNDKKQMDMVIGPDYVGEMLNQKGVVNLHTETPWGTKPNQTVWLFKSDGTQIKSIVKAQSTKHLTQLKPGKWQTKDAALPAMPGYDDKSWKQSPDPMQMGADGDITANAWYRAKIKVAETGDYALRFRNIRDRAALFLDGKRIDTGEVFNKEIRLHLQTNVNHTIALFTAHDGRNKLIFRVGEVDTIDAKGLSGPVTLQKADGSGKLMPVNNWRMKGGPGDWNNGSGWQALSAVKVNSPRFYRSTFSLPVLKGTRTIWRVNTTSLSYGSVWVNGHNLGRYPEKIKIAGHYIPECWLKPGINSLVIYDENGTTPARVIIQTEVEASRYTPVLQFKAKFLP